MIYCPITRQQVELIGKYKPQTTCHRFGKLIKGEFRFVKVRFGEHIAEWAKERGGFPIGTERDVDVNNLVADDGSREIHARYEELPLIDE